MVDDIPAGNVKFFLNLCHNQSVRIQELKNFFEHNQSEVSSSMLEWLNLSNQYYKALGAFGVFKLNYYQNERLIEKSKSVEALYFENNLLANFLLDFRDMIDRNIKDNKTSPATLQHCNHAILFLTEARIRELKKSITTFQSIKDDLNIKSFTGTTIESLLAANTEMSSVDQLEENLMKEAGLKQ